MHNLKAIENIFMTYSRYFHLAMLCEAIDYPLNNPVKKIVISQLHVE